MTQRNILAVGYLLAVMLLVVPMAETTMYALPFTPSAVRWRFGLIGYVGQGITLPVLGLFLAVATAALLRHRLVLQILSVACLLGAVLLVAAAVVVMLDAVVLRREVVVEMRQNYDTALLKALMGIGFTILICGWMGVTGWRAARAFRGEKRDAKKISLIGVQQRQQSDAPEA